MAGYFDARFSIVKLGTGTETLTASNSYVGPTVVDTGTLRVTNLNAIGSGNSAVTINSGTLDMQTSLIITNLNGGGFSHQLEVPLPTL